MGHKKVYIRIYGNDSSGNNQSDMDGIVTNSALFVPAVAAPFPAGSAFFQEKVSYIHSCNRGVDYRFQILLLQRGQSARCDAVSRHASRAAIHDA